jgi:N-acetylmuramoyl-L-alanine amidase
LPINICGLIFIQCMKHIIIDMMSLKKYISSIGFCLFGLLLLFAFAAPAAQDNGAVVRIRAASHGDRVRMVLTAEGFVFAKSTAMLDKNRAIAIDLRRDIGSADNAKKSFRVLTDKGTVKEGSRIDMLKSVGLTLKGLTLAVTVPDIKEIKTFRLQSPSRMVIDIYFASARRDDSGQAAALKPLATQLALKSFVVDAGHGGYEYGIRGTRFAEKDFTLSFARELAAVLAKSGRDAVLVRKSDQVIPMRERIAISNRRGPDIFISIHVSSTKSATVYVVPDKPEEGGRALGRHKKEVSWRVADSIVKNMEKEFSINAHKTELPLSVLMMTKAPAIIIELPNPDEFSYDRKSRERMMSAIIRGLAAGTRDERHTAPVNKPDPGAEKQGAVKAAPKPDAQYGNNAARKAEKAAEAKMERKSGTRPAKNPGRERQESL